MSARWAEKVRDGWPLAVVAGTLLGLGAGAVVYLTSHYASADDFARHAKKSEEVHERLESKAGELERGAAETRALERRLEEDYHWQREQVQRIADRVGAARVAPPEHDAGAHR